jgi:uncharacterized protein YdeI (BOF family)
LRKILTVAALLLALPAFAAENEQQKQELKTDPAVKQTQQPEPNAQGVRTPKPLNTDEKQVNDALDAVRQSPVDLQGNPIASQTNTAGEPGTPAGK